MTEKEITSCESAADVGGNGNLVNAGGVGGDGKSRAINVKANVAHNNNNNNSNSNCCNRIKSDENSEEGFLSTSPDSANGDQISMEPQLTTEQQYQRHRQPTATTTTTTTKTQTATMPTTSSNDTHKVITLNLFDCACPTSCVTLKNILDSFKAPLSEEQAWALIYQFMALYRTIIDTRARYIFSDKQLPESIEQLNLHRDGSVHFSWSDQQGTEQQAGDVAGDAAVQHSTSDGGDNVIGRAYDNNQAPLASHRKIIRKVAVIVYTALDYNLQADEQCQMSQELEELFTFMTADEADDDCIDEGIDEGDNETKELDYVLEACKTHIKPTVPEEHYKAVCRALVTETIELRIFLQQVLNNGAEKLHLQTDSQTSQQELAKLGFNDWARFWVQVIDELRRGVRLKKTNYRSAPIEYQLTPYEILMEDIRSKKYQLRKVMVNGDIPPRVKKDAHAVILEFIRSRPPLKKASERKLPPPIIRTPSPRELLMDSIRKGQTLKHITPPRLKDRLLPPAMTSSANAALPSTSSAAAAATLMAAGCSSTTPRSKQRLIKVDFSLLQDDENFFDVSSPSPGHAHNSSASMGVCSQPKMPPYPIGGYMVAKTTTTTTAAATTSTRAGASGGMQAAPVARNTRRTSI